MAKRTRRAFGKIRKLPSGRYQASYVGPDLVRHTGPRTFEAKMDAEGWLAQERRLIDRELWTSPVERARIAREKGVTLREYAKPALRRRTNRQGEGLRPTTLRLNDDQLERLIFPALGDLPLATITPDDVAAWYRAFNPDHKTQRAQAYGLLKSVFNQASAENVTDNQPCTIRGGSSKKRERKIRPASVDELALIVENMPESLKAAVLIAAWCGLRFGEVAELRRKDIDLDAGTVTVERALTRVDGQDIVGPPKSEAGVRVVTMPARLIPAIRDHLDTHTGARPTTLLFTRDRRANTHWTQGAFYKRFQPARAAAGRDDLRFHDLRHTQAVLAAQTGATLAELMARLGHSTPQAAMRYQSVAAGRDAQIAQALDAMAHTPEPDPVADVAKIAEQLTPEQREALRTLLEETP